MAYLFKQLRLGLLPRKTGGYQHHQDIIQPLQPGAHLLHPVTGGKGQPLFQPPLFQGLQENSRVPEAVQVGAGPFCPAGGKPLHIVQGVGDHQVDVQRGAGNLSNSPQKIQIEAEVWDIMPVHQVDVVKIHPRLVHNSNLPLQIQPVGAGQCWRNHPARPPPSPQIICAPPGTRCRRWPRCHFSAR